ncbi:MAG TPA: YfhO family protein [Gaiellaceae bacterium]
MSASAASDADVPRPVAPIFAWTRGSRVRRVALVATLPALLPVVAFALAIAGGRVIVPGDGLSYYLPVHELAKTSWRLGEIPGWNPFAFAGQPLLATAQGGVLYPLNALFLVLPAFYANNVLVLLNIAIAATGAAMLARRLTGDDAGAVLAGLAFGSCGFFYGHLGHQSIEASVAWLPWALLAYERLRERGRAADVLLLGGALAMAALAGQPQMLVMTLLTLVTYAVVTEVLADARRTRTFRKGVIVVGAVAAVEMLLPTSRPEIAAVLLVDLIAVIALVSLLVLKALNRRLPRIGRTPRALRLLALASILAVGLAAAQLVPTAVASFGSARGSFSYAAATSFSSSATHLPLLLFPYLFGNQFPTWPFTAPYQGHWNLEELAGYPGLACLVLVAAGAARIRRDRRALALASAAALMLLISLGRSTGLAFFVWLVPPLGHFRAWARYVVVADLAVAVLAGYGVAHLRTAGPSARRAACRRAVAVTAALAAAGALVPLVPPVAHHVAPGFGTVAAVAVPLLAAVAAAGACLAFGRSVRVATALCLVLVPLDGFFSFGGFFGWRDSPTFAAARAAYSPSEPAPWGTVPDVPGGIDRYLYAGMSVPPIVPFLPQLTDLKGMRSANGYDPLASSSYLAAVGDMTATGAVRRPGQFLVRRSPLLDLLRISLVLVPKKQAPARPPAWLVESGTSGGIVRYEYRPRVPDAFLVGRTIVASDARIRSYLDGRGTFDPATTALVERPSQALSASGSGRVGGVSWSTSAVTGRVVADHRSLLVVSQAWDAGWSAWVDSKRAPVVRVDRILTGVEVPAGTHRFRLAYETPGLKAGFGVSIASIVVFLLTAATLPVLSARRRSRVG